MREDVEGALATLAEEPLSPELSEQLIDDALSGPAAKRAWTERGMTR
jgi:hypothetical protein